MLIFFVPSKLQKVKKRKQGNQVPVQTSKILLSLFSLSEEDLAITLLFVLQVCI